MNKVAAALGDVSGTKLDAAMPSVECIDAWMTPQLTYNPAAKTCVLETKMLSKRSIGLTVPK